MADPKIAYRTVNVDGVDIFYREAGPKDALTVLLLHGFPSSSHMFRGLIPLLMDKYHIVAPDFPGYGQSSAPPVDRFEYTFDKFTDVMDHFTAKIDLKSYALYLHDIGSRRLSFSSQTSGACHGIGDTERHRSCRRFEQRVHQTARSLLERTQREECATDACLVAND